MSRLKSILWCPSAFEHFCGSLIGWSPLRLPVIHIPFCLRIQMASPALLEAMRIWLEWVSPFIRTPQHGSYIADLNKLVFSLIWWGAAIKSNDATFQLKHRYLLVYCLLIGGHSCFGHCFGLVAEFQWGRKTNSKTVVLV